jgi:WD40 repeat protein
MTSQKHINLCIAFIIAVILIIAFSNNFGAIAVGVGALAVIGVITNDEISKRADGGGPNSMDIFQVINTMPSTQDRDKTTLLPTPVVGLIYDYYNKPRTINVPDIVIAVEILPDNKTIIIKTLKENIEFFDIDSGNKISSVKRKNWGMGINVLPASEKILISELINKRDGQINLLDISGKYLDTLYSPDGYYDKKDPLTIMAISPNGKTVVLGYDSGYFSILDTKTMKRVRGRDVYCKPSDDDYKSCEWWSTEIAADGKTFMSVSKNGCIKIWNIETGELIRQFKKLEPYIGHIRISPDSKKMFIVSPGFTIDIWDIETESIIKQLKGHTDYIGSIKMSPDSTKLVSTAADLTMKIWNVETGECMKTISNIDVVKSFVISSDNTKIITGVSTSIPFRNSGPGNSIKIWDIVSGECIRTIDCDEQFNSFDVSPDGEKLVVKFFGKIMIWRI